MRLPCIMAFLTLIVACGPREVEPESETMWMTGAGPTRGHEDITRLAVDKANDALQGLIGQRPYPKIAKGVAGVDTGNMMVRGNYESDFDTPKMRAFHGMGAVDWHNDGRIQHIHSLRDFDDKNALSLRRSCETIRSSILQAARQAILSYQGGDVEDGRYWLGHATHTIQDSFSPVHTLRSGDRRKVIENICVYGMKSSTICEHATIDLHDRVWKSSFECDWNPNKRDMNCLKSEAKDAVYATEAFLINAGEAIFAGKALDETLQGYFNCESLQE